MTNTTADALQAYLDSLLSGDLERIRRHFADDATWTIHGTLPVAGTRHGGDAIVAFLASATGGLFVPGTQQFTFGDAVVSGDTAVLEWQVTGTGAATGLAYDNEYCGVFVFRDGQITTVREYFDTDHARQVWYGEPNQVAAR